MIATIPALWFTGIPRAPIAIGSGPVAVLVLLALLCAAVAALIHASGEGRASVAAHRRRSHAPATRAAAPLEGYRQFLAARDGTPDLTRHTLSRREAFFAAADATPVRSAHVIDREAYRRNLRHRRVEAGLDQRLLWLLASAKANQSERFAVGFAELYGRVPAADEDPVRVHLHLQETYHTRILADVVALFGLCVPAAPPPAWSRTLIRGLVLAPPRSVLPLVGAAEMIGCVFFRALRDRGVVLCADEPAVAQRVRALYDEILADEISHVGCIAAQLGTRGRAAMRFLYRRLGMRFARQMPELLALIGTAELTRRLRDFRLDAMVAEFPGKAYAAALV